MTFTLKNYTNLILLDGLISKLKHGYSPILLVVGEQRSGKTFYAIWLAEQLEKSFNVDTGLVTSIDDFCKTFSKARQKVIILDEAGVSLDPMRSAEVTQRVYSHIIQSQAVRQNLVILVLPCASDFGHQHKVHIYAETEVLGHNKNGLMIRNYVLRKWRANPNDVDINIRHLETKRDIPKPSKENERKYLDVKQMVDKDSILNSETMRLEMAREKEDYRKRIYQLRKLGRTKPEKPRLVSF